MQRQPFCLRVVGTTNGATPVDVKGTTLLPGQLLRLHHIALHNESGEAVAARFGVYIGATFIRFWPSQSPGNADAAGLYVDIILREGETLACVVTGTANSSKVTLFASGELITNWCGESLDQVAVSPPPQAG